MVTLGVHLSLKYLKVILSNNCEKSTPENNIVRLNAHIVGIDHIHYKYIFFLYSTFFPSSFMAPYGASDEIAHLLLFTRCWVIIGDTC